MTATLARTVSLVSLGCSKTLVDSEVMLGHLGRAGIELVADPAESDVVIVNTCGFIDEAREESIDTIVRYTEMKKAGLVRGVVVSGCLVELHARALGEALPEVDAFLPLSDYSGVPSIVDAVLGDARDDLAGAYGGGASLADPGRAPPAAPYRAACSSEVHDRLPGGLRKGEDTDLGRALLTPRHTAYLRLGEGCNHVCAFCAIPKIRGRLKSKPIDVLVEEADALGRLGVRELTLIAEDSTDYGKDLRAGYGLAELLEGLGAVDGIDWIRVMYAHPATIDERLVRTMAEVEAVLPYLDMPIQHGDDALLRAMRRGTSADRIRRVVGWLREAMPDITLRTTVLVGFPGETRRRFERLMALLEELRFDRVGCFTYSREEGTEAAALGGTRVSRAEASHRRQEVLRFQLRLLADRNRAHVGRTIPVLVDAVDRDAGVAVARGVADAPEIDGRVLVEPRAQSATGSAPMPTPGTMISVRVHGVRGYDLLARP